MTLAFEDANSKLLDVVSAADVDAEERVDDSLVEILKLRFGRDLEPEFNHKIQAKVWSRFSKIILVKSLRRRFGYIFEAEVFSRF